MRPIPLSDPVVKILVFLQGTILVESNVVGDTREDTVRRSRERAEKRGPLGELIPIGESPAKVTSWRNHGAEICYVTASRKAVNVRRSEEALRRWSFPEGILLSRKNDESYADIAVGTKPDIIVEDDCESIGGAKEMIYPNLPESMKQSIVSVVVREFEGIDHIPDNPELLVPSTALRRR